MRAKNVFDKLMGKRPFLYKENNELIIIGGHYYFEKLNDSRLEKLYDKYKKIELDQESDEDKEIFNEIYKKSIPNNISIEKEVENRKEIREHILELDNVVLESYEEQIKKYEVLYKRHKLIKQAKSWS